MCGFFQVISRGAPINRNRFEEALATMKHRGPDSTGTAYFDEVTRQADGTPVHVASGHQRLSILDLDPRSNQPFTRGEATLVFNGEIYNFGELRKREAAAGAVFTTSGDTEVLFLGLKAKGVDFLRDANGMWAFSRVDLASGALLAARDRYGKKPLFYYSDERTLVLSSTVQAIHRYLGKAAQLDSDFADRYLTHGAAFPTGVEQTHWIGIRQVPEGGYLRFDFPSWTLTRGEYFDLSTAAGEVPPSTDELPELFKDAVKVRLVSDRKVGLLLSGGVDSTVVLSALHAMGMADTVHCFIGETGRSDDALYARKCVEQIGIEATVVNLGYGAETLDRVLAMCKHHEKPFPFLGSSIAMSEMYQQIMAEDVRVVLDGTGGDEVFGGYWGRYYRAAIREAYRTGKTDWLEESVRHAKGEKRILRQEALRHATRGLWDGTAWKRWRKRWSPGAVLLGLARERRPSLDPLASFEGSFFETVLRDVSPGGQLSEWIWHNDRNSMMWGIEGRSPILDYRLAPFIGKEFTTKFVREWNKYELRSLFDKLTPLPTQWRQQKQGFRWNGKVFVRENRDGILDCIRNSRYLEERFKISRYVDMARRHEKILVSSATARLLCLAGMDECFKMQAY